MGTNAILSACLAREFVPKDPSPKETANEHVRMQDTAQNVA